MAESTAGAGETATHASSGRLDVQPMLENYTAGELCTVPIVIRNPFDHPIRIIDIFQPQSTLIRADRVAETAATSASAQDSGGAQKDWLSRWVTERLSNARLSSSFGFGSIELFRLDAPPSERRLAINAQPNSNVRYTVPDGSFLRVDVNAEDGSTVEINPVAQERAKVVAERDAVIPPHCEVVRTFGFTPGHWLWSQPQSFSTTVQIDYELRGDRRTQVVPITAAVRPPLKAMVLGAIAGALLGTVAKGATGELFKGGAVVPILTSTSMAVVAVVALSRRSGSQGLVTVEDFYGGFLTGALVAYGGASVFEDALKRGTTRPP